MTRPTRSPRRTAAQWQEVIERYIHSGLTRRAFCAQEGIGESTLGAWQRRLGKAVPEAAQAPALFTEVALSDSPGEQARADSPVPCWDVELDLGDGLCLRVRRRSC